MMSQLLGSTVHTVPQWHLAPNETFRSERRDFTLSRPQPEQSGPQTDLPEHRRG
jgi:hypothetical protein